MGAVSEADMIWRLEERDCLLLRLQGGVGWGGPQVGIKRFEALPSRGGPSEMHIAG